MVVESRPNESPRLWPKLPYAAVPASVIDSSASTPMAFEACATTAFASCAASDDDRRTHPRTRSLNHRMDVGGHASRIHATRRAGGFQCLTYVATTWLTHRVTTYVGSPQRPGEGNHKGHKDHKDEHERSCAGRRAARGVDRTEEPETNRVAGSARLVSGPSVRSTMPAFGRYRPATPAARWRSAQGSFVIFVSFVVDRSVAIACVVTLRACAPASSNRRRQ